MSTLKAFFFIFTFIVTTLVSPNWVTGQVLQVGGSSTTPDAKTDAAKLDAKAIVALVPTGASFNQREIANTERLLDMGERAYPALVEAMLKSDQFLIIENIADIMVAGKGDKTVPRQALAELRQKHTGTSKLDEDIRSLVDREFTTMDNEVKQAAAMKARQEAAERPVQFVISRPLSGTYAPYRDEEGARHFLGGEILTIADESFRFQILTDVMDYVTPDYSGKIIFANDHIFLDHPGVSFPYRIAGEMGGVPVILEWRALQEWKQTGKLPRGGILYFQQK